MIARLREWLTGRVRRRHGVDETRRVADERLERVERIVAEQREATRRVNFVYDRIAPPRESRP